MHWTEEQYQDFQSKQVKPLAAIGKSHGLAPVKLNKHRNVKVTIDGITFDSKKEGMRYSQLKMMELSGVITELRCQVPFVLAPSVTINGRQKPPLRYKADFCYTENGKAITEDVKSPITRKDPVYRIKIHLMKVIHDIDVLET